jgi:hypothetical protein
VDLDNAFPGLARHSHRFTSPRDPRYNCIAWAADSITHWWWPPTPGAYTSYWPVGAPVDDSVEGFTQAFGMIGYSICLERHLESDFEKIALYADDQDRVTHAARQRLSGVWTSKLGRAWDIEHDALEALEGPLYGRVARLLRRPRN